MTDPILIQFQQVVARMAALPIEQTAEYERLQRIYNSLNAKLWELEKGRKLSKAEVDELDRAEAAEWDEDEDEEGD
jgi:hypothetical protein